MKIDLIKVAEFLVSFGGFVIAALAAWRVWFSKKQKTYLDGYDTLVGRLEQQAKECKDELEMVKAENRQFYKHRLEQDQKIFEQDRRITSLESLVRNLEEQLAKAGK